MSEKKKSEKKKVLYDAIISGAKQGLTSDALFAHVATQSPKVSSKAITKAALLALSDPNIKDKATLDAIYDLAIKHRLGEQTMAQTIDDAEIEDEKQPKKKKKTSAPSA